MPQIAFLIVFYNKNDQKQFILLRLFIIYFLQSDFDTKSPDTKCCCSKLILMNLKNGNSQLYLKLLRARGSGCQIFTAFKIRECCKVRITTIYFKNKSQWALCNSFY